MGVDSEARCTISLKGIVQRKGPVALPSSGRNGTIWLARVYASPEPSFAAGKFGAVVKRLDSQSPSGFDRGSSPVGSKVFFLGKKEKKKLRHFFTFPFPHKELPDCRQFVTSLTLKWNQGKENHFCGLEPSNSTAAYDAPRIFNASARDSAVVSASSR